MTRAELVDALTVERFTLHRRRDPDLIVNASGPDWWKAYALLELGQAAGEAVSVVDSTSPAAMVGLTS